MEITPDELKRLKASLDYMENAITDVVGWANDPNTKLRYMHECKRVHELAIIEIEKIWARKET
jgi:hypothetical protein